MSRTVLTLLLAAALLAPAVPGHAASPAASRRAAAAAKTGKSDAKGAKGDAKSDTKMKSETFSGLAFRGIGPALMSGRITDIAIQPDDPRVWYVAAAYGGVWKTINAGTTWSPIFDGEGSSSIGCLAVDPRRPLTVWVGTGENNSQRSVGIGDGVYRSLDGGKKWENLGLKASEHIGDILVDPRKSDVVLVAAQGPLWSAGGDRGVYKTTDGGKTWKRTLEVDEWTGASDLAMDPRDPDVIYATTYQRHRRVWTLIDGGPGSGIWKSTDGGDTWRKLKNGLPEVDLGRIGLAVAPSQPSTIYAIVEAADGKGGTFRSVDGGENWDKRSSYVATSPQYYQELVPDPQNPDRVYSMDTWMQVTDDGGRTWRRAGERHKHVDNHAMWIEPGDTRHMIAGCDGGLYETFDRAATWNFKANLPLTQFYKLCVDNDVPFYNVYGGTQDNNTQGGPSRTANNHGIRNSDWFVTLGGDGFQPRVDPTNPDVVYSELQHGELVRYDRKTGEQVDIQPQEQPGDDPLHWNWDSPFIISPHSHTRLYFGAQRLFRSDDRGDTWTPVSGDLTRRIDRNKLEIMGRVWSVDAVAKNASTSFYGNLVALSESPKQENLIWTGSDDGLIHVTDDGGKNWRRIDRVPGVPELSYVSRLEASRFDANVVYAAFHNHKQGDFKPYLYRSADRGRSWTSIAGDLPERGWVWCVLEDPVNPNLLFCGTESGAYFSPDQGKRWVRLKGGLPEQAIRDMAIQEREGDLVLATFGRGFYVLDDYTPLRAATDAALDSAARLLPVRPALWYVESSPLGGEGAAEQGDSYYCAPNPPFGAVFTYYLREGLDTRKERRQKAEKEVAKKGGDVYYPSWDSLRAEAREEEPAILLTVTDADGQVVRRITGPVKKGFSRVAWDLRWPDPDPVRLDRGERDRYESPTAGPLVVPGTYSVSIAKRVEGKVTPLGGPLAFEVKRLMEPTLPPADRAVVLAFEAKTARLQRAVQGAVRAAGEARNRIRHLKQAILDTPGAAPELGDRARALESRLADLNEELLGDPVKGGKNEPTPTSITDRVQNAVQGSWFNTTGPTNTHRRDVDIASQQFGTFVPKLNELLQSLGQLERDADTAGAPWTPGRGIPEWKPE